MDRVKTVIIILGIWLSAAIAGCANRGGPTSSERRPSKAAVMTLTETLTEPVVVVPFDESAFVVEVEPDSYRIAKDDPYAVTVAVSGNASPVSYVELFVEGESVGQQNTPPYRFEGWFVGKGAFELVALTKLEDNSSSVSPPVSISVSR